MRTRSESAATVRHRVRDMSGTLELARLHPGANPPPRERMKPATSEGRWASAEAPWSASAWSRYENANLRGQAELRELWSASAATACHGSGSTPRLRAHAVAISAASGGTSTGGTSEYG
jgi:hypothetical protein